MGLIARPLKQGGFTTYAAKVAAGFKKILSAELDADIQAVITVCNGLLDAQNIAPLSITNALVSTTAGIAYAKLNLAASIVDADIAGGANINGSKLLATSVALAKLAVGAGIAAVQHQLSDVSASMPNSPPATETIVFEQPWTSRGGIVFVLAYFNGSVITIGAGPFAGTLTTRMRQDGTPATVDGTVLRTSNQQGYVSVTGSQFQPWSLVMVHELGALAPGVHRIKLTAETSTSNVAFRHEHAGLLIVEFA